MAIIPRQKAKTQANIPFICRKQSLWSSKQSSKNLRLIRESKISTCFTCDSRIIFVEWTRNKDYILIGGAKNTRKVSKLFRRDQEFSAARFARSRLRCLYGKNAQLCDRQGLCMCHSDHDPKSQECSTMPRQDHLFSSAWLVFLCHVDDFSMVQRSR
mgnify:FL=1